MSKEVFTNKAKIALLSSLDKKTPDKDYNLNFRLITI